MGEKRKFRVREASWSADREALQDLRYRVFVIEQKVPVELEWEEADASCLHALALDESATPVGTGRLLADGQIGRMAVLPAWRHCGVGGAILDFLLDQARQRQMTVFLNAQTHALGFYERHGFVAEGDVFMDAGIPHRRMTLSR